MDAIQSAVSATGREKPADIEAHPDDAQRLLINSPVGGRMNSISRFRARLVTVLSLRPLAFSVEPDLVRDWEFESASLQR